MRLREPLTIVLACFTGGCATVGLRIEQVPVPAYIKTEVILPVSALALRARLLAKLSGQEELSDPVYRTMGFFSQDAAGNRKLELALAEEYADPLRGAKSYRNDADHAKDLYVNLTGGSIVSAYYYANGKALDYSVSFAIAIDAIDDTRSKVSVRTIESGVRVGNELNLHAMGFVPKFEAVPPSPLDQYKLLAYVAHVSGVQLEPVGNK